MTSLDKIHGRVVPASKVMNVLRYLMLNAKLVFRIGDLVMDSAKKYLLPMPALGVIYFLN